MGLIRCGIISASYVLCLWSRRACSGMIGVEPSMLAIPLVFLALLCLHITTHKMKCHLASIYHFFVSSEMKANH